MAQNILGNKDGAGVWHLSLEQSNFLIYLLLKEPLQKAQRSREITRQKLVGTCCGAQMDKARSEFRGPASYPNRQLSKVCFKLKMQ